MWANTDAKCFASLVFVGIVKVEVSLMYDNKMVEFKKVIFFLDLFFSNLVFLIALFLHDYIVSKHNIDIYSHLFLIPILYFFTILFLAYSGAYDTPKNKRTIDYVLPIFSGLSMAIGALLVTLFFLNIEYISRVVLLIYWTADFFAILLIRWSMVSYFIRSIRKGSKALHVLIIGTGERAKELSVNLLEQAEWGVKIIGHLDPDINRVGMKVLDATVIGTVEDISDILKAHIVDEVIIAIPRSLIEDAEPIVQACEEEGIKLQFMADIYNVNVARIRLTNANKIPLLTMEPVAQDEAKLLFKRCFDFILTLIAMPLIIPLIALISIAIKIDSKGPVFFVQQRVGLKKRLFPMIKFRSMYVNAEEKLKDIIHLNEAEGPIFKMKHDPRVTPVGKFIRKTSLDELPQLFNVFIGQMSLVGPRPMSIRDVDLFDRGVQRKRFSVKPGITCIWQISGRSNLPFEKWLELDLNYIDNWSLYLDLKILFLTIPAVLKSRGAV